MEIAYGRKFPFAPLGPASRAMDLEIRVVPDPNFGSVKSYHARAWREAYGVDVPGWTGSDLDGECLMLDDQRPTRMAKPHLDRPHPSRGLFHIRGAP